MTEQKQEPKTQSELETAIEQAKAELAEKTNSKNTKDVASEFAKVSQENEELKKQMAEINAKIESMSATKDPNGNDIKPQEQNAEAAQEPDKEPAVDENAELKKKLADMQEQLDQVKTRKSVPNLPQNQVPAQTPIEQARAEFKKNPNGFLKKDMEERFGISF